MVPNRQPFELLDSLFLSLHCFLLLSTLKHLFWTAFSSFQQQSHFYQKDFIGSPVFLAFQNLLLMLWFTNTLFFFLLRNPVRLHFPASLAVGRLGGARAEEWGSKSFIPLPACGLALGETCAHSSMLSFCLPTRGGRWPGRIWVLSDCGGKHHPWTALHWGTSKKWTSIMWKLWYFRVVYYSCGPVLVITHSFGWDVMSFGFAFRLKKSRS